MSMHPAPGSPAACTVMVLAYNEERNIKACLDSIFACDPGEAVEVFVMANGCTDRTESIVRDFALGRAQVTVVSIPFPDKGNAWNVFVHEVVPQHSPGRDVYFFVNGDARVTRGSFSAMRRALQANPHANAASAVPGCGRNAERYRRLIMEGHGLVANLYALRGSFLQRLHAASIRIPLNLEDDDGLIGALVKWDLFPEGKHLDPLRVAPCADATYEFHSLSPLRPVDWATYWNRIVRYAQRGYEQRLLVPMLEAKGMSALPSDITELFAGAGSLRLKWQGIYTFANWIALQRIRKHGKSGPLEHDCELAGREKE